MKKALLTLLITIASGLILLIVLVVVADPFFHYHEPLNRDGVYLYNEAYQAPGMASNFSYDTIMIGSSMTENYHVSWFEEYDESAVKLCYSGAQFANLINILDMAFKSGNDIKHIYMDINDYQLSAKEGEIFGEIPEYLYDDNYLTDVQYVFNEDVVIASVESLEAYIYNEGNEDEAFTWEDEDLFGREHVIDDISTDHESQAWVNVDDDNKNLRQKAKINIKGIIDIVELHPEVQFTFIYPPYSMAYWYEQKMENLSFDRLDMYMSSMEELLMYDNVEIYFFMDDYETITNLDNYRDMCHYKPDINKLMLECMHDGRFKVQEENIEERMVNFQTFIDTYEIYKDITNID